MSATTLLRAAAVRSLVAPFARSPMVFGINRIAAVSNTPQKAVIANGGPVASFSTTLGRRSGHDEEETFEQFTDRFEKEFDNVQDVFELQRNLNNSFAYDLVPSTTVITAALKAARRVNDYPTAVRIFEGIRHKVENRGQYEQYLQELEPLRKELGIDLRETLYPDLEER